jgi:chitinase
MIMKQTSRLCSGSGLTIVALALFSSFFGACLGQVGTEEDAADQSENALTTSGIHFKTVLGNSFVGAKNNGGGAVVATATVAKGWETFTIDDLNGGALTSGDSITIRAGNGQYFQALNGGGSTLNAASNNQKGWETFRVVKDGGSGVIAEGDTVGLQTSTGSWLSALNGGGGDVDAHGKARSTWESFIISGLAGNPTTPPPPPPPPTQEKRVIGYLPNWYQSYSSWASKIDFDKLTHLNLAFAVGDSNGNLQLAANSDVDAIVKAAHAHGVKVFPSLCGGGNDSHIAPFYEPGKVDEFVDKIINYALARKLDGVDVDVEAPNKMGAKYDTFIAKLRAKAHANQLEISAAVAEWMQSGMSDATLRSFDFVNIMAYDNTGTWTGAGEHSSYQQAVNSLHFYENKGVAKDKIVLGVPFYGYCWGSCGGSSSKYILYKDILAKFPNAGGADWIEQNGAKYSYNGSATMTKKTLLAEQYGGIMIWELGGDVSSTNSQSLLRAVDLASHR